MKIQGWLAGLVLACALQGQTVAFKWVDTYQVKGQGICQTAPFRLQSDRWRVNYDPAGKAPFELLLCDGNSGAALSISKQYRKDSALSGRKSGWGTMELGYLSVTQSTGDWTLSLSQYLDIPGEWYLRKWDNPAKHLLPFGSWLGEPGERSWSVEVKDGMGRFACTQSGAGRLSLEIVDESGTHIGKMVSVRPGTMETWFYHPGIYTITISAINCRWNLAVESVAKK